MKMFFFNKRLQSHNPIEIVLQVINAIINFFVLFAMPKNQQFLKLLM